jgi:predicted SAM-dependent methyltransferase
MVASTPNTESDKMKIELGGGANPKRNGFINLDRLHIADTVVDFELGALPYADDTVDSVYSAHCLEHVRNLMGIVGEILRVCKIGASVEIRVPYWLQSMAMCYDHKHTISEDQIQIWCQHPQWDFPHSKKKLSLKNTVYVKGGAYDELRKLFPQMSEEQVMKYVPNCCHEVQFLLHVVSR